MPWKETHVDQLRMKFVVRALDFDSNFSALCREFGISRKTGYKWLRRYQREGLDGLSDRSRRPHCTRLTLDFETGDLILELRDQGGWGPKKIHERLKRNPAVKTVPSISTIARLLKRKNKVKPSKRGRPRKDYPVGPHVEAFEPNDLWTVDFKGWWRTRDGRRCEPLTVRDAFSRFVFCVRPLPKSDSVHVRSVFEELFRIYGLPKAIRCDNGSPFASLQSPLGLTTLNAWWRLLGIELDRIAPGHPEQNGAHERMHLDLAKEIQPSPAGTLEKEIRRLEKWRMTFNVERPHEALEMKTPWEVFRKSSRRYPEKEPTEQYPLHYAKRKVGKSGQIKIKKTPCFITEALRGRTVGLEPNGMDTVKVWYCNLCLGFLEIGHGKPLIPLPVEKEK